MKNYRKVINFRTWQKYLDHFLKSRYFTNNYFSAQGVQISPKQQICGIIRNIQSDECVGVNEVVESDFWQLSVNPSNCGKLGNGSNIFCYNSKSRYITKEGIDGRSVYSYDNQTMVGMYTEATPWRLKEAGFIQREELNRQKCWQQYSDQITQGRCDEDDPTLFDFQIQKTGA